MGYPCFPLIIEAEKQISCSLFFFIPETYLIGIHRWLPFGFAIR